MKRKDIRDTMLVILLLWIVVISVILIGWEVTSESVYIPEENRRIVVYDENWSNALGVGAVGIFVLGFLVLMSPSPEDGG